VDEPLTSDVVDTVAFHPSSAPVRFTDDDRDAFQNAANAAAAESVPFDAAAGKWPSGRDGDGDAPSPSLSNAAREGVTLTALALAAGGGVAAAPTVVASCAAIPAIRLRRRSGAAPWWVERRDVASVRLSLSTGTACENWCLYTAAARPQTYRLHSIDLKNVFLRSSFWSRFLTFFLFSKRFLFLKSWQSSERRAD